MTDPRIETALVALKFLRDAYAEDQGGADLVYGDAIFALENYDWDDAVMDIRLMAKNPLSAKSHVAYIKVRDIIAPGGYEPLAPVSDDELNRTFDTMEVAAQVFQEAKANHERLVRRRHIIAGEANLAEREAAMKGEGI